MMLESTIRRYCPTLDQRLLEQLAEVWEWEVLEIIRITCAKVGNEKTPPIFIGLSGEMTLALAKLITYVAELVVKKHLQRLSGKPILPETEWERARSDKGREVIENTATILAERIWSKQIDGWIDSTERILEMPSHALTNIRSGPRIVLPNQDGQNPTVKNHFIPVFTNRCWTDKSRKGQIRVFLRRIDNGIRSELRSYKDWGFDKNLYRQSLEDYFSVIESKAAKVYSKLLAEEALTQPLDDHWWTVFLVTQFFRSPSFMSKHNAGMNKYFEKCGISVSHPHYRPIREIYPHLFNRNIATNSLYRMIFDCDWCVFTASSESCFLKPDNPVVILSNQQGGPPSIVYPLSEKKVFMAMHLPVDQRPVLRVKNRKLDLQATLGISLALAGHASNSLMTSVDSNTELLEGWLPRFMGRDAEPVAFDFLQLR